MLRVYNMTDEDIAIFGHKRVDGPFRLTVNVEIVKTPKEADVVTCPMPLREHTPPVLDWRTVRDVIEWAGVDERRLAFADCSDDEWTDHGMAKWPMYIRCNLKPFMLREMPNSIPWWWPVEDYKECVDVPEGGFKHDVSGHMWISGNVRKNSCESMLATPGLDCDIKMFNNFTGYVYDLPEGIEKRKNFRISMRDARVSLCPISIPSVFPYRYYEAMSAGRAAILVGDDFNFPFTDKINYDEWTLRIPVSDCHRMGPIVKAWMASHTDKDFVQMGQRARLAWQTWLHRDNQSALWAVAIEDRLRKNGLIK